MRASLLLVICALFVVDACKPKLPDPPTACDAAGKGCLSDELCVDLQCVPRPKCETSDDCDSAAFECVLPAQVCKLRSGFGEECDEPDAPCAPGSFCALGACRLLTGDEAPRACAHSTDCDVGQHCDQVHFRCIEAGACTLAEDFPELRCDAGEECDALTGQCTLPCQEECTVATEAQDCGGNHCDGACRCVQCVNDDQCGPGLVCDERAGRCQSENLCFTNDDCETPLVCDPSTLLCQVAPPACQDDFDCNVAQQCDVASGRCLLRDGPCADDRFEPANTPARARLLEIDPADPTEEDLRLCPGDDDVYAIALLAGDVLIINIDGTEPAADATAWLLDSSGERSLRFTETPPRGNGAITYVAQSDETVFLRVTAIEGATPYEITLDRSTGAPCAADFFEDNGSIGTATPPNLVPDGAPLEGEVCPNDVDFFRVNVAAGEALSATLNFDASATDLDLAFFDQSGTLVAQDAGSSAPEFVRHRFSTSSSVFIRVRGFGTHTGPYTSLIVDHEPPFVCAPDGAEPDSAVADAPVLALNEERPSESRTMCQQDQDLFVVPLEDFERLVVTTGYEDADVELVIDVLDATGTTVKATSPPARGGATISYDAEGDETVVVRVRGKGGAVGAYSIAIDKENQLDCAPDAQEPNATVATRAALPSETTQLSICGSDQDFFAIEGIAGKKLIVDAGFRQAEADIDLILIGLDGRQTLAVADGTADGEHLEVVLPLDGTYTLRVFSLTSGARARYTLATDQVTP